MLPNSEENINVGTFLNGFGFFTQPIDLYFYDFDIRNLYLWAWELSW